MGNWRKNIDHSTVPKFYHRSGLLLSGWRENHQSWYFFTLTTYFLSCLNVYKKAHHVLGDRLSGLGLRSAIFGAADADRSEVKGCRRVTKKQEGLHSHTELQKTRREGLISHTHTHSHTDLQYMGCKFAKEWQKTGKKTENWWHVIAHTDAGWQYLAHKSVLWAHTHKQRQKTHTQTNTHTSTHTGWQYLAHKSVLWAQAAGWKGREAGRPQCHISGYEKCER